MKSEKSCGAIVLSPDNTNRKVLLIKHENGGHWAFPKGHVEEGETEVETALREIKEETGLSTDLSTAYRKSVSYSPAPGIIKEVVYFIAFAHTETIEKQDAEVTDFAWMPFNEALQAITYDNDKSILQSAIDFIEGMKKYEKRKGVASIMRRPVFTSKIAVMGPAQVNDGFAGGQAIESPNRNRSYRACVQLRVKTSSTANLS